MVHGEISQMKFEILTDKDQVVMTTTSANCIPDVNIISYMSKANYKFKLNGKIITKKKLEEFICTLKTEVLK